MTLEDAIKKAAPSSRQAYRAAQRRWDSIAKPLGSLGLLESVVCRLAAIKGSSDLEVPKKGVVVMCADNGVVEEEVTQTGQEVTAIVTENMSKGMSSVCKMSKVAGADVFPVDIGVYRQVHGDRIIQKNIRRSTANMTKGPAMTRQEAIKAIETGIEIVSGLKEKGYGLLATGEMGIGNTTSSSAIAAVLLDREPSVVTGRGSGLSSEGLARKIKAIEKAIEINKPNPADALDVLSKVGGLDIAGLAGVFIGGAACKIPVLVDGFISGISALVAVRLCPNVKDYILASHISGEPAGDMVLEALELEPFLNARMRLGEGTGAVAVMPIIDMALAVYCGMSTFDEVNIEAYTPQE
ncbi:MAG: nicotinate-nucleotide--dimethylbenzimidazole phosphoribosyltransferase [Clostridiales bacterium]|jgi:nicotinate-nucleotide--dimethylbenzimidazole phosphoribosyltransferase|nr:nicotinate-nucleotide--dimethylbenzimidazole phosphoribosyltransferase [Clostridiales bacterium]